MQEALGHSSPNITAIYAAFDTSKTGGGDGSGRRDYQGRVVTVPSDVQAATRPEIGTVVPVCHWRRGREHRASRPRALLRQMTHPRTDVRSSAQVFQMGHLPGPETVLAGDGFPTFGTRPQPYQRVGQGGVRLLGVAVDNGLEAASPFRGRLSHGAPTVAASCHTPVLVDSRLIAIAGTLVLLALVLAPGGAWRALGSPRCTPRSQRARRRWCRWDTFRGRHGTVMKQQQPRSCPAGDFPAVVSLRCRVPRS